MTVTETVDQFFGSSWVSEPVQPAESAVIHADQLAGILDVADCTIIHEVVPSPITGEDTTITDIERRQDCGGIVLRRVMTIPANVQR